MRVNRMKLWDLIVIAILIMTISTAFIQNIQAQNDSSWSRSEYKEIHGNFSPVVDQDGSVYIGTKDGYVYCFDRSGELRWKNHYELEGEDISFVGGTLGEDGDLYFAGRTEVIKLDTDGVVQWKHRVSHVRRYYERLWKDSMTHPPVVTSDGDVFLMTYTIWKVNMDGAQRFGLWEGDYHALQVDDHGYVYVILPEHGLYALDPEGVVVWGTRIDDIEYQPVIRDEIIYVASGNTIYAIDSTDGNILWNTDLRSNTIRKPLIHNGEIIVADMGKKVYRIEASSGTILDSFSTPDHIWCWSLGKNDTIIWSSINSVSVIDLEGNLIWDYDIRGHLKWWAGSLIGYYYITGEPVVFDNRIYILTNRLDLFVLAEPEGNQDIQAGLFNLLVLVVFVSAFLLLVKICQKNEVVFRRGMYSFFFMISAIFISMYVYAFFIGFIEPNISLSLMLSYFLLTHLFLVGDLVGKRTSKMFANNNLTSVLWAVILIPIIICFFTSIGYIMLFSSTASFIVLAVLYIDINMNDEENFGKNRKKNLDDVRWESVMKHNYYYQRLRRQH